MTDFFKDKRVLVTGGSGFVGTNLTKRLLSLGAKVRATIHKKPPVFNSRDVEYVSCDLTKKADCEKVASGVNYVFMCAANTSGAAVMEKTPLVHVTPNVLMNSLMLEASYEAGAQKFLFISSNTVYPVTNHAVKEDEMSFNGLFEKYFCVGWMKIFTEILCEMYAKKIKNPMKTVVVRPGNIYGPHDDYEWATSHVLPALMRKVIEKHSPLEVWGDGRDIKDFIYIDDFMEGLLLAMQKIETFDPINIASGKPVSVKEALRIILNAGDYSNAEVNFNTSKPTMIPLRLIDVSKAKQLLGFEAKTSFEDGIKNTIKWYREGSV
ncbi:MAG: NAD-dependent epimerase/dehydratase family protein [Candidatus Omnitrophota bacterium]